LEFGCPHPPLDFVVKERLYIDDHMKRR